jgi:hypothetical protein
MTDLILYHTPACHLCEDAQSLLAAYLAQRNEGSLCLRLIDIAEDDALVDRYGILIPVLHEVVSGRELKWPFDMADLVRFVESSMPHKT